MNAALLGCITGAESRIRQSQGVSANANWAYPPYGGTGAIRPYDGPKIRN
jgi:hypothetical protein